MLHVDVSYNVLVDIQHYNPSHRKLGPMRQKTKKILRCLLLNVAMTRDCLSGATCFIHLPGLQNVTLLVFRISYFTRAPPLFPNDSFLCTF